MKGSTVGLAGERVGSTRDGGRLKGKGKGVTGEKKKKIVFFINNF